MQNVHDLREKRVRLIAKYWQSQKLGKQDAIAKQVIELNIKLFREGRF